MNVSPTEVNPTKIAANVIKTFTVDGTTLTLAAGTEVLVHLEEPYDSLQELLDEAPDKDVFVLEYGQRQFTLVYTQEIADNLAPR